MRGCVAQGGIVLPERGDVQYSATMKPVVGLTGGIACGKTTVAEMFGDLGIPVIDADQLARDVVEPGTPGLEQIVREFGKGVLDRSGHLDRKKVGDLVFGDEAARETLNAIMHPLIRAAGAEHMMAYQDDPAPYLLYEAALSGGNQLIQSLFGTDRRERRGTPCNGSAWSRATGSPCTEANARIASQLPLARKLRRC